MGYACAKTSVADPTPTPTTRRCSVQGRDLWAVTIGDPSGVHFPDPANPDIPFPKARAAVSDVWADNARRAQGEGEGGGL